MATLSRSSVLPTLCASFILLNLGQFARAADLAPAKPPPSWWDTFAVTGAVEAGITINPADPANGLNFGHLFTDKANSLLLNQALLTIQRPIDPTSKDYDFGFKIQGMYGSDARYTHFLGELDYAINDRYQLDVVEANVQVHLPWLFSGGIDVKAGQYVTLEGAEVIPAGDNLLYSHSYIFNFGIPFKLTGITAVAHVIPEVDIYAGVNTGVNTTFGNGQGDNNGGAGFEGGIGLNLLGGNLTVLAITNIGPQNADTPVGIAACGGCNPNSTLRFLNDMVVIWKATDKLIFTTDVNYIHDDAAGGLDGYGIAQYAAYAINDWLKIVGRAEVWRDNNNFFVSSLGAPGNFNFANAQHGFPFNGGFPVAGAFAPAPTTYLELTLGLNISAPAIPEAPFLKSITVRPEIRYDSSLNSTTPFDVGTKSSQLTFGGDIIVKF